MRKHRTIRIRVFNWNPNGTNDVELIKDGKVIDCLPEALFGLNIGRVSTKIMTLESCLKHIAVSPVEDGSTTLEFLSQYFGPVMGRIFRK
jgi:uncharacterized protein YbbK (DUF523 family)